MSTFEGVGTLGKENFESVQKHFKTLACTKKLDNHVLIGDFNFPEVSWPDANTYRFKVRYAT